MITPIQKLSFNLRAFLLLLVGFIIALYLSWMVNAASGYGYSWLYGFYESKQHIEYYAPQNKYRKGFETTSEAQHKEYFQQIVESVHGNGEGLAQIKYPYKGADIPLLHHAEIVHLQDVANLINTIHMLAIVLLLMFSVLLYFQIKGLKQYGNIIALTSQLLIMITLILSTTVLFFVVGAKEIFYQMHVLIFPEGNQWFFYYQDSLMSTLMKAPDLFAGIAVQILLLGLVIFFAGLMSFKRGLKRF